MTVVVLEHIDRSGSGPCAGTSADRALGAP
jgi:hypothetical protein